ncbi:Calm4 [Symbiodinium pilosum]|uniref:Calm4 protein n=1 Tax=Symbiodinium pilosum TaxID=2952 RepID=A0A812W057_SYMPI|nr:Calm4 [Symbiodinium pilosum]
MKGGRPEQLSAFADFASKDSSADIEILTADFNEDFAAQGGSEGIIRCPFAQEAGRYMTIPRAPDLPQVSRPPNKQEEGQASGKGKIDYIWVRERTKEFQTNLVCDPVSRSAILESHRNCEATGDWPSDHGCEACSLQIQRRQKPWWKFWSSSL